MPRPSKLTPEQEFDAYQRAKEGESYDQIAASLSIHKSNIARLIQRMEARAVAAETQPPAQDPRTGVQVEITDELLAGQIIRDLSAMYHRAGGDADLKLRIAHALPALLTSRHRVRQPTPNPRPPSPPAPSQPPDPQKGDELVRFSN